MMKPHPMRRSYDTSTSTIRSDGNGNFLFDRKRFYVSAATVVGIIAVVFFLLNYYYGERNVANTERGQLSLQIQDLAKTIKWSTEAISQDVAELSAQVDRQSGDMEEQKLALEGIKGQLGTIDYRLRRLENSK